MYLKFHIIISLTLIMGRLCTAQYSGKIRVMTYNINAEKHGSGVYTDIAEVINEIGPDIAGLQKIDSCNSRNPADVLQWLGEQTSCKIAYAPAIKNYENGEGSYGVGFLCRQSPLLNRKLWIEHTGGEQDRAALQISITMGGENVRVIVTHLAHEGVSYRTAQIKEIISWIDSISRDDPVIIMADFNAKPTESSMKILEAAGYGYVKGKNGEILDTSSNQGINHILFRPLSRWHVTDAGNPEYKASNRNPVWADLELLGVVRICGSEKMIGEKRWVWIRGKRSLLNLGGQSRITVFGSVYSLAGRKCVGYLSDGIYELGTDHFFPVIK